MSASVWGEDLAATWQRDDEITQGRQTEAVAAHNKALKMTDALQKRYRDVKEQDAYDNPDPDMLMAASEIYQMNQGKAWEGEDSDLIRYGIDEMGRFNHGMFYSDTPDSWPLPVIGDKDYMKTQDELGMVGYEQRMSSPDTTPNQKLAFLHLSNAYTAMDMDNWSEAGRMAKSILNDPSSMGGIAALAQQGFKFFGKKAAGNVIKDRIQASLATSLEGAVFTGSYSYLNQEAVIAASDNGYYRQQAEHDYTQDGFNAGIGGTVGALLPVTPLAVKKVWDGLGWAVDKTHAPSQLNSGISPIDNIPANKSNQTKTYHGTDQTPANTGIDVYHGSSNDFASVENNPLGEFREEFTGSGEGATAAGAGTYTAQMPDEARSYRDMMLRRTNADETMRVGDTPVAEIYQQLEVQGEYDKLEALERLMLDGDAAEIMADINTGETHWPDHIKEWFVNEVAPELRTAGSLYHAKFNTSESKLINWDDGFTKQPSHVKAIVVENYSDGLEAYLAKKNRSRSRHQPDKPLYTMDDMDGSDIYRAITLHHLYSITDFKDPVKSFAIAQQNASKALSELGIDGVKVKDSKAKGKVGDGSNYVAFNPRSLEIIGKYGIAGLATGLAITNDNEGIPMTGPIATELAPQKVVGSKGGAL